MGPEAGKPALFINRCNKLRRNGDELDCVLNPIQKTFLDEAENLDTETQNRRVKLCEGRLEFPIHHPNMSVTTQGPLRASKKA